MSFCRWSTNDFKCDLYCFESNEGFMTYVAGNRVVFAEPIPPYVPLDEAHLSEYMMRHQKVSDIIDRSERVPIGLEYDGRTFCDSDLEDFISTLKVLKEAGYRFPFELIDELEAELKENK